MVSADTVPLVSPDRFGVCQNALCNEGMRSDLDLVVEAGVRAVALLGEAVDRTGIGETARLLAERHLSVSSFISGLPVLDLPDEQFSAVIRERILAARELGAPVLLVTTGGIGAHSIDAADREVVRRLRHVSSLANDCGVTLGLEPIHPFLRTISYVHTLDHAGEIVGQVPGAGIVFDTGHLSWDRRMHQLIAEHSTSVCSVQLTNLSPAAIDERRWVRSALDDGVVPVEELVRSLESAGYRGYYEEEVIGRTCSRSCLSGIRSSRQWLADIRA